VSFNTANSKHTIESHPTQLTVHIPYTADIQSTLDQQMDHFIQQDSSSSFGVHHKRVRQLMIEPIHTTDDIPFTQREVQAALENFDSRKATAEDALTSETVIRVSRSFPSFFTEVYKECLHRGYFTQQWNKSIILPIVKLG